MARSVHSFPLYYPWFRIDPFLLPDIIEQINLCVSVSECMFPHTNRSFLAHSADSNQMALHSTPGCFQSLPMFQTGLTGGDFRTGTDCSTAAGCVVKETAPNSYGAGFAQAGGGVWAAQFDVQGIL